MTSDTLGRIAILEGEEARILRGARAARRWRSFIRLSDRVVLVVVILAIWEFVVWAGWVREFFISRPTKLGADLFGMFASGMIWPHLALTSYETVAGLVLGTVLGVITGFIAGLFRRAGDALEPLVIAFNSMPRIAIAPLFIIWFGFGPESKIALAALVVYFGVFFNTFSGIRSIEPVLLNNIRTMGGSEWQVIRMVTFPSVLAWVFAATKVSISLALLGAVVGEFVGSTGGLGWLMLQASGTINTTRLFSCLIILSIFGSLLFFVVKAIEDWAMRWRPNQ